MSTSEPIKYSAWLDAFSETNPDLVVLSSKEQAWTGVEVAQISHAENQVIAPAFQSHLLLMHLVPTYRFVEKVDGKVYQQDTNKGDTSIVPAGLAGEWYWNSQPNKSSLHVSLDSAFVQKIAAEIGYITSSSIEILHQFVTRDSQIEHIGLALKAELESGGRSGRLFGESLATALTVHLLSYYSSATQPSHQYDGGLPKQTLRTVIDYINDYLTTDIKLPDLAAVAGISQSHFVRLFKQSTGLTPHQYVIRSRVNRARQLLLQGGWTIKQVALLVGFADQSHLTYHFKRLMGITPKEFLQK